MATKILLIRHGESQQNTDDVLSGISDIPLSEKGQRQCILLARFFEKVTVDKVFATPLQRAKESAKLIFPMHKYSLEIAESLIEFNYGEYEGYRRSEYDNSGDRVIQQWITAPASLTFPNGDNIQDHAQKSFEGLSKIASDNQGLTVACISHRTTMRLVVAQIIGLPLNNFRSIPCSNCGITELTFEKEWRLQSLNVTPEFLST